MQFVFREAADLVLAGRTTGANEGAVAGALMKSVKA
jgi:hypothetical protein